LERFARYDISRLNTGFSDIALGTGAKEGEETLGFLFPIHKHGTVAWIGKEQPEDMALAGSHRTEINQHAASGLIPGNDIPARAKDKGRVDTHSIKYELECRVNGLCQGQRVSRQLPASEDEEMGSLIGIQL
jgi:hypothetical protein